MCSTRSSDATSAKFDFDDPEQCQICFGFNPFKEEPIEGEELEGDKEPSADSEDEEEGDEEQDEANNESSFRFVEKKKTSTDTGSDDDSNDSEEEEEETFVMTRQQKLDILRTKVKDWIGACSKNISDAPLAADDIKWFKTDEGEGITAADHYTSKVDDRWSLSKCEFTFDPQEEFIDNNRCL